MKGFAVRKLHALLAVTTAAVAVIAGATSASAGERIITGAYGYFDPSQNKFGIGDTEPDGRGVYVEWKINGVSQANLWNKNGSGSWRDVVPSQLPNGQNVAWRIRVDGGATSSWSYETS
ncbi:hypothetical protein ABTY00_36950 [Streptomyces microflavus]|uniref:hypothetical protein n=1 Tax=Streptomyces microflavus TaxID=1919 RepID=UPI00331CD56E